MKKRIKVTVDFNEDQVEKTRTLSLVPVDGEPDVYREDCHDEKPSMYYRFRKFKDSGEQALQVSSNRKFTGIAKPLFKVLESVEEVA